MARLCVSLFLVSIHYWTPILVAKDKDYSSRFRAQQESNNRIAEQSLQRARAQQESNNRIAEQSLQRARAQQESNNRIAEQSLQRARAQQEAKNRIAEQSLQRARMKSGSSSGEWRVAPSSAYPSSSFAPQYVQPEEVEVVTLAQGANGTRYPFGKNWMKRQPYRNGPITTGFAGYNIEEWVIEFRLVVDANGREYLETNPAENPRSVAAREKVRKDALDSKRAELSLQAKADESEFDQAVLKIWWAPLEIKIQDWLTAMTKAIDEESNDLTKAKLRSQFSARKKPFSDYLETVNVAVGIEKKRRESYTASIDSLASRMLADGKQASDLALASGESRKSGMESWESRLVLLKKEWEGEGLSKQLETQPTFATLREPIAQAIARFMELITEFTGGYRAEHSVWREEWVVKRLQEAMTSLDNWEKEEKDLLNQEGLKHVRKAVSIAFEKGLKEKKNFLSRVGKLIESEDEAEQKYLSGVAREVEEAFAADVLIEKIRAEIEARAVVENDRRKAARESISLAWQGSQDTEGLERLWARISSVKDLLLKERGRYPLTEKMKSCAPFSRRVELEDLETNFAYTQKEVTTVLYAYTGYRSFECVDTHAVMIVESVDLRMADWDKKDELLSEMVQKAAKRNARGWAVWTEGSLIVRIEEPRLETISFRKVRRPSDVSESLILSFSDGVGAKDLTQVEDFSLEFELKNHSVSVRSDTLSKELEQKSESWESTER